MVAWFIGGFISFHLQLVESQAQYDAGDKSAMAWMGFLPFLIPIFLMNSAFIIAPVAIVLEFILWLLRDNQS
jgi:hypothetical protein